jgi:hypothetical protein
VKALRRFLALPWRDRLLLLEAAVFLGAARAALLTVPFRLIAAHLGKQIPPDQVPGSSTSVPSGARRVAWAVEIMARHTPWDSACLARSIAGKFMLRRRGFPSWLFLGTMKDPNGNLMAHAWLRYGQDVLIGAGELGRFTALSSFGDPPPAVPEHTLDAA